MRDSDIGRPQSEYGTPGGGPDIIRVRGHLNVSTTENRRLRWVYSPGSGSGSYSVTPEVIEFFPPDSSTAKQLAVNEEAWVIWRTAARRWEEFAASGSSLRWGAVTTEITAATAWGTWGAGYYQEYDDAGATVGSPVEVDNWYPTVFAVDTVVCVDTSFSPPRVVSASCEVMPE